MDDGSSPRRDFEAEVAGRFGILPNFFRSAAAAPELIQQLWGFAKAGYLDNPMPAVFKERLFVWLSRFCPMRYCIVRHVGFLLGDGHGHAAGDPAAAPQTIEEVLELLRRPSPWQRDMAPSTRVSRVWRHPSRHGPRPAATSRTRSSPVRRSCSWSRRVASGPGAPCSRRSAPRRFEFFSGCLAFIRTAHYWTMLHPEIESEDDMRQLMRRHEELARLLLDDPEADRCEMGQRLFEELIEPARAARTPGAGTGEASAGGKGPAEGRVHRRSCPRAAQPAGRDSRRRRRAGPDAARRSPGRAADGAARPADRRHGPHAGRSARRVADRAGQDVDSARARRTFRSCSQMSSRNISRARSRPGCVWSRSSRVARASCTQTGFDFARSSTTSCRTPSSSRRRVAASSCHSSKEEGHAAITVRDSGVGFDEQFAAKLFEPFTQREQGRDRAGGRARAGTRDRQPAGHAAGRIAFGGERGTSTRGRCSRSRFRWPTHQTKGAARTLRRRTAADRLFSWSKTTRTSPTASSTCSN